MLSRHMWQVVTILENATMEHFRGVVTEGLWVVLEGALLFIFILGIPGARSQGLIHAVSFFINLNIQRT